MSTKVAFECTSRARFFRNVQVFACLLAAGWTALGWHVRSNLELLAELERLEREQAARGTRDQQQSLETRKSMAEYLLPVLPLAGVCFVGAAVFYARRSVSSLLYDAATERLWVSTFDVLGRRRQLSTPYSVYRIALVDDPRSTARQYLRLDNSGFNFVVDHEHGCSDPLLMHTLLKKSNSTSRIQFNQRRP